MCEAMIGLTDVADVITPNLTEASFLLRRDYADMPQTRAGFADLAVELSNNGTRSVVLTGASDGEGTLGAAVYDRETKQVEFTLTDRIPGEYHGTGDVFTSVLTGALLRGKTLTEAAGLAARFVRDCAERSRALGVKKAEGVDFEALLYTVAADKL
jgi:pyridoxine kinase